MNPRVSALNGLVVLCYFLIFMFLIRTFIAKYPDNNYSKALSFLT